MGHPGSQLSKGYHHQPASQQVAPRTWLGSCAGRGWVGNLGARGLQVGQFGSQLSTGHHLLGGFPYLSWLCLGRGGGGFGKLDYLFACQRTSPSAGCSTLGHCSWIGLIAVLAGWGVGGEWVTLAVGSWLETASSAKTARGWFLSMCGARIWT